MKKLAEIKMHDDTKRNLASFIAVPAVGSAMVLGSNLYAKALKNAYSTMAPYSEITDQPEIASLTRKMGLKGFNGNFPVAINTPATISSGPGHTYSHIDKFHEFYPEHVAIPAKGTSLSKTEQGILSHELGHAQNNRLIKRLNLEKTYSAIRRIATPVAALSAAPIAMMANKEDARNVAIASSVPAGVRFGEELLASLRGFKNVKNIHALSGMPMYAATAAIPAVAYLLRNAIRGE